MLWLHFKEAVVVNIIIVKEMSLRDILEKRNIKGKKTIKLVQIV